jgi:DNA modification methylase
LSTADAATTPSGQRAPTQSAADGSLHMGDNLHVLREQVADGSVDLVYLDPPFKSGGRYRGSSAAEVVFEDVWSWTPEVEQQLDELTGSVASRVRTALSAFRTLLGESGMLAYLTTMAPRLDELRRVLSPTGSLYLHCDGSASHYLKVLMDAIFGEENFLNNIVWLYGLGGSSRRYWPRKHDDILWYSRERGGQYFEPSTVPARSARMKGQQKKAPDFWDIPAINNMAAERVGYPTQKPEALLGRIIESSSRPGDVVLDPCCGSGTTLVVARRLGRRWIGIDRSPTAIELSWERLSCRA